jgi:hypothetical protein
MRVFAQQTMRSTGFIYHEKSIGRCMIGFKSAACDVCKCIYNSWNWNESECWQLLVIDGRHHFNLSSETKALASVVFFLLCLSRNFCKKCGLVIPHCAINNVKGDATKIITSENSGV